MNQPTTGAKTRAGLIIAIWAAQILVAVIFCYAAYLKIVLPIEDLPAKGIKWAVVLPAWAVRGLGAIDLAGGLGIILPSIARIMPRLSGIAAIGCVSLQACAIAFHISRGEADVIGINILLITASAFVAWGRLRSTVAP